MRALFRLAGWGVAAASALLIAMLAAHSTGGQQRLGVAIAALTGQTKSQVAKADPEAARLARLAATETDTRRLTEIVRTLSTDRERLMARLTVLERNLEDVTGSIRRQVAAPPPTPTQTAAPPPPSPSGARATPQDAGETPNPGQAPTQAPSRVATVSPSGATAEPDVAPPKPALGVDVGGAASFDGLRTLWNSIVAANPGVFDGMHPVVVVRENSKNRTADLRLTVGPLTDAESATRICATLTAGKRFCRSTVFEGAPLALVAPEPRRPKAAPAPERKAPPRPPAFPK
jgi:hypothetical protein